MVNFVAVAVFVGVVNFAKTHLCGVCVARSITGVNAFARRFFVLADNGDAVSSADNNFVVLVKIKPCVIKFAVFKYFNKVTVKIVIFGIDCDFQFVITAVFHRNALRCSRCICVRNRDVSRVVRVIAYILVAQRDFNFVISARHFAGESDACIFVFCKDFRRV